MLQIASDRLTACLLALAIAPAVMAADKKAPVPPTPIAVEAVRAHVEWLADPKRQGRSGTAARESARYIRDHFRKLKLQPLFAGDFFQPVPGRRNKQGKSQPAGQNVGAFLPGRVTDEIVIISAHYDHLGIRNDKLYPGADDNASGVAMMLEVARQLAARKSRGKGLKRSVAFVGFDLEERLLWGSRWFAAHPPWPLKQVKLFITADMIGRSLGNLPIPTVFCLGSEHAPELKEVLDQVGAPRGLEVARLGIDLVGTRSDYGAFRDRKVPFLFFSTGEHPDYHTPNDQPDRIDYPKLARISNLVLAVGSRVADGSVTPTWTDKITRSLDEPRALYRIADLMLQDKRAAKLTDLQKLLLSTTRSKAQQILKAGKMTANDRKWLVGATQLLLFSVF